MTGQLAVLALLWLVVAGLTSCATALLWPALERASRSAAPALRARRALAAAVAPLVLPSAIVLLCALPGLAGAISGAGDHCAAHADHPHFCPVHASLALTPLLAISLAAFLALVGGLGLRCIAPLRRLAREGRWLARRQSGDLARDAHLVGDAPPLALTVGLLAPEIWISRTLFEALSPDEREVVLAHERAHVHRRDPARLLGAAIASALQLPKSRRSILRTLRLACEQACDARAARVVGDPLRVASTLLRVERLMQRPAGPLGSAALLDTDLRARVEALLSPAPAAPRAVPRSRTARLGLALASLLLLASPVHHLAEHVLELLLRSLLRSMVGLHLLS